MCLGAHRAQLKHSNFTYCTKDSVWDPSYSECVRWCCFLNPTRGPPKLRCSSFYKHLILNTFHCYHLARSVFILIRSKGHNGRRQYALRNGSKIIRINRRKERLLRRVKHLVELLTELLVMTVVKPRDLLKPSLLLCWLQVTSLNILINFIDRDKHPCQFYLLFYHNWSVLCFFKPST